eukprot:c20390_g1_i3.p1 GENE.c20390_g1_i3~~c20390_g1_i3.p1  ORF type:complete len:567 (+),score=119.70 c20390_g1_i3:43-1701(+)
MTESGVPGVVMSSEMQIIIPKGSNPSPLNIDEVEKRSFVFQNEDLQFYLRLSHKQLRDLHARNSATSSAVQDLEMEQDILEYLKTVRVSTSVVREDNIDRYFSNSKKRTASVPVLTQPLPPLTAGQRIKAVGLINLAEGDIQAKSPNSSLNNFPESRFSRTNDDTSASQPDPFADWTACDGAMFTQIENGDVLFAIEGYHSARMSATNSLYLLVVSITGPSLREQQVAAASFFGGNDLETLYSQSRLVRPQRPVINVGLVVEMIAPFSIVTDFHLVGQRIFATSVVHNDHRSHDIEILSSDLLVKHCLTEAQESKIGTLSLNQSLSHHLNCSIVLSPGEQFTFLHVLDIEFTSDSSWLELSTTTIDCPFIIHWRCRSVFSHVALFRHTLHLPLPPPSTIFVEAQVPPRVSSMEQFNLTLRVQNVGQQPADLSIHLPDHWLKDFQADQPIAPALAKLPQSARGREEHNRMSTVQDVRKRFARRLKGISVEQSTIRSPSFKPSSVTPTRTEITPQNLYNLLSNTAQNLWSETNRVDPFFAHVMGICHFLTKFLQ